MMHAAPPDVDAPCKEGWLNKKTSFTWHPRYFTLRDRAVVYFDDEHCKEARTIPLSPKTTVAVLTGAEQAKSKYEHAFVIHGPKKYTLAGTYTAPSREAAL